MPKCTKSWWQGWNGCKLYCHDCKGRGTKITSHRRSDGHDVCETCNVPGCPPGKQPGKCKKNEKHKTEKDCEGDCNGWRDWFTHLKKWHRCPAECRQKTDEEIKNRYE